MKPIEKDELYQHLHEFLKNKGIEMKDGSYAERVQKGCGLLTDVVNLTQKGVEKARSEIDKRLDQMRQVIHEKTAPSRKTQTAGPTAAQSHPTTASSATAKKGARAKTKKSRSKPRRKS